jgi:hypothetical protein
MKTREFREEFLQLVRNDEIHIRLFSLHLYLLTDRLKQGGFSGTPSLTQDFAGYIDFRSSLFVLHSLKFPRNPFMYHAYASFHSHLPEELFFDDFNTFFKKANQQTSKQFGKAFEEIDRLEEEE